MTDTILARVDKARALLVEARDATDAKRIADMAKAAEVYAKRQQMAEEVVAHATAIRIDAMTLMGEFLKTAEKNKGTPGPGRGRVGEKAGAQSEPAFQQPPTLAESGITKKESSAAQALADMKQSEPELYAAVRAGDVSVARAREAMKEEVVVVRVAVRDEEPDPRPNVVRIATGSPKARTVCSSKRGKAKDAAPSVPAKWSDVIADVGRFIERIEGGGLIQHQAAPPPTSCVASFPAFDRHSCLTASGS